MKRRFGADQRNIVWKISGQQRFVRLSTTRIDVDRRIQSRREHPGSGSALIATISRIVHTPHPSGDAIEMLAPISVLQRTKSLITAARHIEEEILDDSSDVGSTAEDALERIHEVYEPLMGGHRASGSGAGGVSGAAGDLYGEDELKHGHAKRRATEVAISYFIFFILGTTSPSQATLWMAGIPGSLD